MSRVIRATARDNDTRCKKLENRRKTNHGEKHTHIEDKQDDYGDYDEWSCEEKSYDGFEFDSNNKDQKNEGDSDSEGDHDDDSNSDSNSDSDYNLNFESGAHSSAGTHNILFNGSGTINGMQSILRRANEQNLNLLSHLQQLLAQLSYEHLLAQYDDDDNYEPQNYSDD